MLMFLRFFQAADKHGGLGVAGIRMDMLPADQIAPCQRIAAIRVGMYLLPGLFRQGMAGIRMCVLRNFALFFQCDGWQDQRIGGAEYHHTGKHGHYPMAEALPFVHPRVFFRIPQNIIPHTSFTTLLISTRRSPAEARPGIRSFQQSAHRKCSPPRYCGNPLRWNDGRPYRSNGYPAPDKAT